MGQERFAELGIAWTSIICPHCCQSNDKTGNHKEKVDPHPSNPEPAQWSTGREIIPVKMINNVINDNAKRSKST
ncbi:hypothetical protein AA3990_0102 [Gluconobacter roseus NBRC 3990]|nr:hypothetical protein AA3990_0102 [Gluconobacter roseus NBRC 3990]